MNNSTLWAAVCVCLAILGAGVALSLSGMDTAAVIGLLTGLGAIVGTLVAGLDKLTTIHRINAEQDEKIEIIEERTNGGLEPRIQSAVEAALADRFGPRLDSANLVQSPKSNGE